MSTTLEDLQTRLSYRLAEDGSPSDTNEYARRTSFINEGYRKILGEHYWWFLKTTSAQNTIDGQEIYTLPSTYRDIIELRYNRKLCVFLPESDATGTYNYPPLYYQYRSTTQKFWIFGDQELHLIPVPSDTPSTLSVASLTSSGTTATLTTTTAHGLQAGDYVEVLGADQTGYNGVFYITDVPATTSLTYTVDSGLVTPATGTITAQWQNLQYRFYYSPTMLSDTTDVIAIPDQFSDILVAYAYGRYGFIDDQRGNAGDGFEEYNQIRKDLISEHNRRSLYEKATPPQRAESIYE